MDSSLLGAVDSSAFLALPAGRRRGRFILLCGGIGCGKSVVARILRLKGFGVFDCDFEARRLMQTDFALMEAVKAAAGEDVYRVPDGESAHAPVLDRRLLAERIFADDAVRGAVNAAVHSAVRLRIGEWLLESPVNLFVESAVPVSSGLEAMAAEIWEVTAPLDVRIARVALRDARPREEILSIIRAQQSESPSRPRLLIPNP